MTVQYSIQKMVSDGTLSTIALGIQYLQRNDIYIRIAGVETPQSGAASGYTWSFINNTTLKILPVVPTGVEVTVYRRTDIDAMYNIYSQNAQFDEATIDENNEQLLYIAQEYLEQGIPGAGVESVELVREDGALLYYRIKLTDGAYTPEFIVPRVTAYVPTPAQFTFASGGTLAIGDSGLSVLWPVAGGGDEQYYVWEGTYPKDVPPASSPSSTGGIAPDAWQPIIDIALRQELASETGSSLIGFGQDNASDIFMDTHVTPNSRGAVGDGVADDTSAVNAAIGGAGSRMMLRRGDRYRVGSVTNPLGVEMDGAGHIVKSAAGGLEAQNTYADHYQRVTGQENLAAWYRLVYNQHKTPTRALKIIFSGDSTTAGDGTTTGYKINELVNAGITARGLQGQYNINCINAGHSGAHTGQWETTYVSSDIASNPDLYVLRWGINDPGYLKSGAAAPLDAGQNYPDRRDVTDFATSLRNGLATFRAAKPFATTSILLMMPNSTYDIPNARDSLWYEQLRNVYVQAARDFKCAFIDTYAIMQDSRLLATILLDNPYSDGRGIHPNDVMNNIIAGHIVDLVAPKGLQYTLSTNKIFALGGNALNVKAANLPSDYSAAVYMSRALTVDGWPIDGNALTFRTPDDTLIQYLFGYTNADRGKMKVRYGRSAVLNGQAADWSQWFDMTMMGGSSDVTPASGFSLPSSGKMRVAFTGTMACFDGYVSKSSPSVIAANTLIATILVGYTPVRESAYGTATVWDGASFEQVPCVIATTGDIRITRNTTLAAQRIYINVSYDSRA